MSVYCNRWRPRYADLRRAVAHAQRPAQGKGKLRHLCPYNLRAASTAAAGVAPWRESLLSVTRGQRG